MVIIVATLQFEVVGSVEDTIVLVLL